ncbi:MAG: cytochrome c biogenesis protein CcsA [Planctomycetes bacterium]|nr:cytochrome c biogenesis protein CcsA [Planctomycetota bacterium]MCW8135137.1 cytochrome c biogenesis protein CcsA [Planctomycetota bacterium]
MSAKPAQSPLVTLALAGAGLIGALVTLYLSYFYTPVQVSRGTLWVVTPDGGNTINLYESYRIFFVHLPAAYATAVCSTLAAIGGAAWLLTRKEQWQAIIVSCCEVGLAVGAIVLLTGTFWADYAWGSGRIGSGWNWEPRLTTMLILWFAFAALLVLRRAIDGEKAREMMTAVYGILIGPLYPLVSKAVEIGQTSHPRNFSDLLSAPEIATTKHAATVGIMLALASLIALRYCWNRLGQRIAQERAA